MAAEKEQLRAQWLAQFDKALKHDTWGQFVEAQDEYQMMAAQIANKQGLPIITSREKDTMHRIVLCLSARAQALSPERALSSTDDTISSADMALLESIFRTLFTGTEPEMFPVEARKFQAVQAIRPHHEGEIVCAEGGDVHTDWTQSQAALRSVTGTVVSLRIEKIGLKDAQEYIDPFMTIMVADPRTNVLDTHDSPVARERHATHVIFNHQVYLNVSLEDMMRQQAALFFEFKHYKPKKKKVSTRCWCFMELNELKRDEEIVLEVYHKPTDLKKKKVKLHSEKPLYLHLVATFISSSTR
jgi:hypothetical protein